jgi:hypothetical protein
MKWLLILLFIMLSVSAKSQTLLYLDSVENKIKIGKMAGNRNLAFGIKNILEEYLQEKEIDLTDKASQSLKVEIIFLDVLTTSGNLSVFHKSEAKVIIRLRGFIINRTNNQILKSTIAEQSASEISMSTLVVDTGGKLNQQNLSIAIKKSCDKLVTSLLKQ